MSSVSNSVTKVAGPATSGSATTAAAAATVDPEIPTTKLKEFKDLAMSYQERLIKMRPYIENMISDFEGHLIRGANLLIEHSKNCDELLHTPKICFEVALSDKADADRLANQVFEACARVFHKHPPKHKEMEAILLEMGRHIQRASDHYMYVGRLCLSTSEDIDRILHRTTAATLPTSSESPTK